MSTHNLTATFTRLDVTQPTIGHKVYTKTNWADDWVLQPYLFCNGASWAIAPAISTAELSWNYGEAKRFDKVTWETVLPDSGSRRYVKIVWNNDAYLVGGEFRDLVWYGQVVGISTRQGGVDVAGDVTTETGQQGIECEGLESILDDVPIRTSRWFDGTDLFNVDCAFAFNPRKADGTQSANCATSAADDDVHYFSAQVLYDDAKWRATTILRYLFAAHTPKSKSNVVNIPFELDEDSMAIIDEWFEYPTIECEGRTFRELLNIVLRRKRGLSWRLYVAAGEEDESDVVKCEIISLSGDNLTLSDTGTVLANPRRWKWNTDEVEGSVFRVLSHMEAVDRIRIRGAKATSVFSISFADGTLVKGWPADLQTAYNAGASGTAAYAAATGTAEKQRLNAIVRGLDKLRTVYARFAVVSNWDGVAYNGEGGGGNDFQQPGSGTPNYKFCPRTFHLLRYLPLKDGYDYTAIQGTIGEFIPPVKVSDGPHNRLPPLVVIKIPGQSTYIQIEKVGNSARLGKLPGKPHLDWTARVTVPEHDRALMIDCHGKSGQHSIASAEFTVGTTTPVDERYTLWNWKEMICTVAAEWDAYCEGVYPETASVQDGDYVRELVIYAPHTFRRDYLVPGTVIGITNEGQLVRSSLGGHVQDDRKKLADRALLGFAWFGTERRSVQFSFGRINGTIRPGDYVTSIGDASSHLVESVVTEVRIDCQPAGLGGTPQTSRISYKTDFVGDVEIF